MAWLMPTDGWRAVDTVIDGLSGGGVARDLVLAVGLPVALLLIATLLLQRWQGRLPPWLRRLSERPSLIWNAGIGLILALSLLRWWLQR
ncbi:hypothetical protein [Cyanobium sp. ATX 6F1]|uniref:hypothetical protein n=1 Tax=unclassified Cyanobium TaxID=2627006 RepID=UPI0020CD8CB2|nr:hypothetical protein [Cyanobium sp. ATX 6F1]